MIDIMQQTPKSKQYQFDRNTLDIVRHNKSNWSANVRATSKALMKSQHNSNRNGSNGNWKLRFECERTETLSSMWLSNRKIISHTHTYTRPQFKWTSNHAPKSACIENPPNQNYCYHRHLNWCIHKTTNYFPYSVCANFYYKLSTISFAKMLKMWLAIV